MAIFNAIIRSFLFLTVLTMLLSTWRSGQAQTDKSNGMIMIPAGSFVMGSNDGPEDERPAHRVELKAFAIDRTPITNALVAAFLNAVGPINSKGERLFDVDDNDARIHRRDGNWSADPGFENHPVVEVSWFGARDYCAWVGKRLPTEAEWEKAACWNEAEQKKTLFPWGNSLPIESQANLLESYLWNCSEVGSYPQSKSSSGCYQMIGDVWEWTSSEFVGYPGFKSGFSEYNDKWFTNQKVLRGGSFGTPKMSIRGSYRNFFRQDERWLFSGFRCAQNY